MFSIGFSVLGIITATLFLLTDFDTIEKNVENNLPKKYEWSAAFGLAFTVIWIYLKVLDLLLTLSKNK
ncbi:Bax inhibitor-1/YccA family protein [uncultured Ruminococcus sp.]|uniref:Bax inhibitor-1/YccA family membrane protein n=1 Tax=uncultured Ruminococcus sp. TaxID=165186 RepID=UPI0025E0BD9C|nr:Bax inhibitor-1/YccA family protein [uncultured Ruminococcus sp.]